MKKSYFLPLKVEKILSLLKNFFGGKKKFTVFIESIDILILYFSKKANNKYLATILDLESPSIRIFLFWEGIEHENELNGYLDIPFLSHNKLGKIINILTSLYGGKIDFIFLSSAFYKKLINLSINIIEPSIYLLNGSYFKDYYINSITFKRNLYKQNNYYALVDLYNIIEKLIYIKDFLYCRDWLIDIFKFLDKRYGRSFPNMEIRNLTENVVLTNKALVIPSISLIDFYYEKYRYYIDSNDSNKLNDSYSLITVNTSSPFYKFMFFSDLIITENTNLLSHASIVCEQLKKPLIQGFTFPYFKIFTGDIIQYDGVSNVLMIKKRFWE